MILNKLTEQLLDKTITEIQKPENMNKIKTNVLNPCINYTYDRIYPYIYTIIILFLLNFILALLILVILLRETVKKVN
jgi:hypothetical protein